MKQFVRPALFALIAALLTYFTYAGIRAHSLLVSLNVRDMEVGAVLQKLEWQTWEIICAERGVKGRVTLNVKKAPLADVLLMIERQTLSHSQAVYPIYGSRGSLREFEKVVRGEIPEKESRWTEWSSKGAPIASRFAGTVRDQNERVTMQLEGRDAKFAAAMLSRFSRARVLAEDGTRGIINFKATQATLPDAVASVAHQLGRKWAVLHVLSPGLYGASDQSPSEREMSAINFGLGMQPKNSPDAKKEFGGSLNKASEALMKMPSEQRREVVQKAMGNPGIQNRVREAVMSRINAGLRDATPDERVRGSRALMAMQNQ